MRMLRDQPLELAHEPRMPAERESRLAERLQAGDPQLPEPRDLGLRELLVGDVVERRASPQCERLLERPLRALRVTGREQRAALVEETDEAVGVDLVRTRLEHVAAAARAQPIRVEQLTQPGDVRLQALVRRRRLHAAVQVFEQPLGRNDLVAAQQQDRQERALPRAAELQRTPIVCGLERPEDSKVHTPRNHLYPAGSQAATGELNPRLSRSQRAIGTEEKIMKLQVQRLAATGVLVFAAAAFLASGASAANAVVTSPDAIDRYLNNALQTEAVPDAIERYLDNGLRTYAVRPDDRAEVRGPALASSTVPDAIERYLDNGLRTYAVRPDDRAEVRGPALAAAELTPSPSLASGEGFQWNDAAIGAGAMSGSLSR